MKYIKLTFFDIDLFKYIKLKKILLFNFYNKNQIIHKKVNDELFIRKFNYKDGCFTYLTQFISSITLV